MTEINIFGNYSFKSAPDSWIQLTLTSFSQKPQALLLEQTEQTLFTGAIAGW